MTQASFHDLGHLANKTADREDPIEILKRQESDRLQWLLPVRHSRMAQNPFAFFRGGAAVMAADLARHPHSGLIVQLCGDAHLLNFGFYASPERSLLFDINDFDETHLGPFEWDVLRLASSMVVAARSLDLSSSQQEKVCRRVVRAYAKAMDEFASMPIQQLWAIRLDLDKLIDASDCQDLKKHLKSVVDKAIQRDSRQAVSQLCEFDGAGGLQFIHEPPLVFRFSKLDTSWQDKANWQDWLDHAYTNYLDSIHSGMRKLLSHFRLVDVAYKAVGVGSVGTRCAIMLFLGDHPDELLVLQSKQALPSVLAPYLNLKGAVNHQGERVVEGQKVMQTASDAFLGWTTAPSGEHLYWRHFRDWKGSVDLNALEVEGLTDYGKLCAWTLAKAHARSGNRRAISNHIGIKDIFAESILELAVAHANQSEEDYKYFVGEVASGALATSEVF